MVKGWGRRLGLKDGNHCRIGQGRAEVQYWEAVGIPLTWIMAAPPQDLIQEGSLVSGGQWDLPVTELLPQAAVQQAQHHVVGGTGTLGERHTLWLCPTHTVLSSKPPAAQCPRLHPDQHSPSFNLSLHLPYHSLTMLADLLSIFLDAGPGLLAP